MYEKYRKYKAKYLEKKLELSNQTEFEQVSEIEELTPEVPEVAEVPEVEELPEVAEPQNTIPTQVKSDTITLNDGRIYKKFDYSNVLNYLKKK